MIDLSGKTAIVTGGSSGNGRAICIGLARAGAKVLVADQTEVPREGGLPTTEIINSKIPDAAKFFLCDVSRVDDLEKMFIAAEDLGEVDILVNNAGILKKQPLLEATEDVYQKMMDVNVKSVLFASQAAARVMIPRGKGSIINIGSIAGMRGTGGFVHYNATKGAVRLLSYALADELGPHGIRVNVVAPGIMNTQMNVVDDQVIGTELGESYLPMIPARRWGTAGDVADMCIFLASDMSTYVSGASHVVDGGYLRI